MKTLSMYQPWATLVVIGAKKWETRSWATKYRGQMLIHASKRFDGYNQRLAKEEPFFTALLNQACPTGMIIGKVDLADCITTDEWMLANTEPMKEGQKRTSKMGIARMLIGLKESSWKEHAFGDFSYRRYAWKLDNPVKFDKPVPARGSLGIWEFGESALGHLAREP